MAFVLLGLAILAVWLPSFRLRPAVLVPAWLPLFLAAIGVGLLEDVLEWPALISIASLLGCAVGSQGSRGAVRAVLTAATACIALGLALHRLPGFDNPVHLADVRVSADGAAFTQYLNFDKGAAGLVLLAFYAQRGRVPLWRALLVGAATVVLTLALAVWLGRVHVDPKWPPFAVSFLVVNLLFTCVAEEAFFRGLLQERIASTAPDHRAVAGLAVAVSAGLFGLAHLAGGPVAAGLAAVAGLGYAAVYAVTRRVEAAVLLHFAVNATHFLGFTYPYLTS